MVATSEKPYRVYRQPTRVKGDGTIPWGDVTGDGGPGGPRNAGVPRRIFRFLRRAAFVAIVVVVVWATVAFLSFRSAVNERNDALPKDVREALAPANGPAIAASHVTLLVGSDTSGYRRRVGGEKNGRADTLLLMRVDVPSRTVSMLSIPRDLYVEVPGYGNEKINAAYANGGLPLAIRTVRSVTNIDVNHVAQIDFDGFKDTIDALGGVEIDNPYLVESGAQKFDGRHWRFRKGRQTLSGRDALAYARIRYVSEETVALNEQEGSELGRARRQQRVIDAMVSEIVSKDSLLHPRDVPRAVVQPLLTDISAAQMLTFGFGKWWSKPENSLRCRLGGDADSRPNSSGVYEDVVIPDEENRAVVRMFLGKQAPVPPDSALSAGCVRASG